jgi:hypothetical protein
LIKLQFDARPSNETKFTHAWDHEADPEAYKCYEAVPELISGRNTKCHMAASNPILAGEAGPKVTHVSIGAQVVRRQVLK